MLHFINRFLLFLKRNQRVKGNSETVKLNVGSGFRIAAGWINIDSSLNAYLSRFPKFVLSLSYRFTTVKNWYYICMLGHLGRLNTNAKIRNFTDFLIDL